VKAGSRQLAAIGMILCVCSAAMLLFARRGVGSPAQVGQVHIAGPEETVFDWRRQACEPAEVPDLPARAFRNYRHRTELLISHYENFRLVGRSLDRLHRDCHAVLRSPENASPQRFEDREWLASLYTTNGRDVWALVHDEYQGNRHSGRCPQGQYEPCWYNSITLAYSTNGGRSFSPRKGPRQPVAPPSLRYEAGIGPVGVFTPSNIVTGPDGAHYVLVRVRSPGFQRGVCLLRTGRIGVPGAWRAWDGLGFTGSFSDPYSSQPAGSPPCIPIEPGLIAEMSDSLTYNVALGRYLLVGLAPPGPQSVGPKVTGVYFSTSTDLIHWTPRTLVVPAVSTAGYVCGGPSPIAYPSVIDPRSPSRTFETSGRHPYLYFTQFHYSNCHPTAERDLLRVPLEVLP
jgi:hypothetical protein